MEREKSEESDNEQDGKFFYLINILILYDIRKMNSFIIFLYFNLKDLPPQFEEMTNQLQICNWLVAHPEILNLANKMLTVKSQDTGTLTTPMPTSDNNYSVSIIWKNL